jgi:cysteine sulfinate desulfinase/cysteine desulfurase-like protein
MGLDARRAKGAVRLSTGFTTTIKDIETAADSLISAYFEQ